MKWIDVKDKQPDKDKAFLGYVLGQIDICYFDSSDNQYHDYYYKQVVDITHWMPLPPPPASSNTEYIQDLGDIEIADGLDD